MWTLPSVAGTGTGGAISSASTGVRTTGSAATDSVDGAAVSGNDPHAATSVTMARTTPTLRILTIIHRSYGVGRASGSMSCSVRNMKKNTTQPIAEMKSQLTRR